MNIQLTKEADALICLIYKEYLRKRDNGITKDRAKFFGSSVDIWQSIAPKWNPEDADETCWELERAGMLSCLGADNIAYEVALSDQGIIYMENRFKAGMNSVLAYLAKIKSIIPFV